MNKSVALTVFILVYYISSVALATDVLPERVLWEQRPIPLHIQTGHERIVHFPDDVRYWLPDNLKSSVTVIAANGVLYIQAHRIFPSTRIRVQGVNNHTIYLLDVSADDKESASDTLIVMESVTIDNLAKSKSSETGASDWPIRLTRYAAQQLYAPERLLAGDPNIINREISTEQTLTLIRGGQLESRPIASWSGGGLFVTAVELRNITAKQISLRSGSHPKNVVTDSVIDIGSQLRGRWVSATLQHGSLGPKGSEEEVTVLYLVSERPFIESFNGVGW